MNNPKWFNILNDKLELSVKARDCALDDLEIYTEAVLTLLRQFDIKRVLEDDPVNGHNHFDASLNRILEEIHFIAEQNGWQ